MRYYGLLSYKWGAVDGAGAMAEAATQDGPAKMMTSIAAIAGWATKDPAAAQAWLASNQSGNEWEKSAMERGLVNGLARTNPAAAEAYVTAMKDSGERSRMTQVLMEEKMKQGPDAAAAWAASLTDPEMKRGALESIADQLSRSDPAKGIELIKANAADPSSANAAGTLARRLADKDIKQGLSFAQDLPAGAVRNEAFTQAYSSYAGKDSAEAAETINLMANGADRDAAVRGLAPRMAREEPQAARTWAESITDPDVQLQTMQDVLRSTARSDREGTIAYMTEKGWTQEQQDTILNAPNDGPGRGGFGGPGGGGFGGPRRNR